jgi:hypothetical protein
MTLLARLRPELLLPIVAGLLFLSPMLLTDRSFGVDWTNHLWLIQTQAEAIRELGHPSRFFSAEHIGAMYPHFAFYGSTWYSVAGALSVLSGGSTTAVYIASFAAAFAVSWLGWWWLARELGVRGLAAHAPALIFTFAAFRITVPYAGGAYSEYIAPCAIPLVAAAAVHLLRAPQIRALPALALAVGVTWMTGTHNVTLVWGSVTLALVAVVVLAALPGHGRELDRRRIAAVVGLAALAAAVNAWFLLPDVSFAGRVRASTLGYDALKGMGKPLNTLPNIFDPFYRQALPNGIPRLYVQLPVLALAWCLVVVWSWRRAEAALPWRRAFVGLVAVLAALLVLIVGDNTWVWDLVPHPLRFVQYPHRLHNYTTLITAGLVLVTLAGLARSPAAPRHRRLAYGSLAAICVLLTAVGTWQAWATPSTLPSRAVVFATPVTTPPPTWYDPGLYRDVSEPVVATAPDRRLDFPITPDAWAGVDRRMDVPDGRAPIATNLAAGPYLLKVEGLRWVGRTEDGFAVLARERGGAMTGPVHVSVRPADGPAATAGLWITIAALLGLAGWIGTLAVRGRRHRDGEPEAAPITEPQTTASA